MLLDTTAAVCLDSVREILLTVTVIVFVILFSRTAAQMHMHYAKQRK